MKVRCRKLANRLRLQIARLPVGKHKPYANDHNQRDPGRDQPAGLRLLLLSSVHTFFLFTHIFSLSIKLSEFTITLGK